MPLVPGTRPGGGIPIKMPPSDEASTGKYLRVKTEQTDLEYINIEDEVSLATKDWVADNYTHEILDGGNF